MIPALRPQPDAGPVIQPESPAWLLSGRNFQTFAFPDPLHTIFADPPARLLQQRRNAPVPEAAVLTGQGDDRLRQAVFIMALRGLITLCSPRLTDQSAGPPFTQAFFPSVLNGEATPLGT